MCFINFYSRISCKEYDGIMNLIARAKSDGILYESDPSSSSFWDRLFRVCQYFYMSLLILQKRL